VHGVHPRKLRPYARGAFEDCYWKDGDPIPKPLARDKVEAAKNVVMLDLAILNAEAAAGMFKKPIEALAKESTTSRYQGKCVLLLSRRGRAGDCCRGRLSSGWRRRQKMTEQPFEDAASLSEFFPS
jgi:hypothetical protein